MLADKVNNLDRRKLLEVMRIHVLAIVRLTGTYPGCLADPTFWLFVGTIQVARFAYKVWARLVTIHPGEMTSFRTDSPTWKPKRDQLQPTAE